MTADEKQGPRTRRARPARPARRRTAASPILAQLLTAAVEANPTGIAVEDGDRSLTYLELDAWSSRLARELMARGIGPETFVPLAMSRSMELIVATWAVSKTGGAFVALDPAHPRGRLDTMIGRVGATIGLTVDEHRPNLPDVVDWLSLDDDATIAAIESRSSDPIGYADRLGRVRPENTAYIIHTSGSTGVPKGIELTHTGVAALTAQLPRLYHLETSSRVLTLAAPSFDVSVLEILMAISTGATMVISPVTVYGGPELAELIRERAITHAFITPSVLTSIDPDGLDGLTDLLAGGEAISPELVSIWAPGRRLYNVWGPAECTIADATSDVPMSPDRPVTLGRPIEGITIRVLDERLRPVPVGVVGEAYIGGSCVGRDYRNQHALTASRFIADPDGPPGARLYRSGDLVRWTTDGELEILGRSDFQVKIRGLRIELGEVESAMAGHPDVEHAVAMVRRDAPNQVDLVGYVVGLPGRTVDGDAVRARMADQVPGYMVPVEIVVLDEFPLTTNRKLDRDALPAPQRRPRESRAPQTPSEQAVAEVFREVLEVPDVGADDDFFTLGGNSLSATQVITRVNSRLGVSLVLRTLFDASTVAGLAARVDESSTGGRLELAPRPRPERIPLSMAQQRLWFLNRLDSTAAGYNIVVILRLTGALDVPALSAAVGDLFARHEVLRTVYPEIDGVGHQEVRPLDQITIDLAARPVDERDIQKLAIETFEAGFDVTSEIPIRLLLLQVGPDDYVLVIGVHHIAADGLSMGPLTRDMMLAYESRRSGRTPSWQPLPVQYVDYTLWQREVLGDESSPDSLITRQIDYWREQLAGLPEQIDLPTDRPRPRVLSSRGGAVPIAISADAHAGLAEVARKHNATMFMVVHAALAILLSRLSAGDDIAIGSPIGGRGEEKLDGLIGMFVNTLVFRTRVDPAASVDEIMADVRETDLQALAHADVPFERLVEVLNPARSRSRHPLFQVGLSFQNLGASAFELSDLRVSRIEADADISQFDLHVIVSDQFGPDGEPAGLVGELTYVSDLYDRPTAEAFVQRLIGLLEAIAFGKASGDPVGDLDLLNAGEYRELVEARNATAVERRPETLANRFTSAATTFPDRTAIVSDEATLSYAQFTARVNRLARRLIDLGVGPDIPVAIRMQRSSAMLVAIHAVIQAGGAYVPIDPDAPQGRLEYVLSTSRPAVMLVDAVDATTVIGGVRVLTVDDAVAGDLSAEPIGDDERIAPLSPSATAYIIFTSGSTGRPKGVAVSHESIVNRLAWMQSQYRLEPRDVVLHKTPTTFDVSVWELFWPFEVGATMVIARPDGHRDPGYLAETMRAHRVTTVHFVPSMLAAFVDDPTAAGLESPTRVFCSGEALPAHVATRAEQIMPNARVHNLYGPTEAAVDVTYHEVSDVDTTVVPIGRPVDNTSVYVLDSRLHLAPEGVVGELYLGGVQLARGYVSRPDLTADRFVANHFGEPGSRLYRTGDLVRWERGELVYIGRSDFQVKLRGLRIELGEVETVLAADEAVAEAVVLVRNDQLVAYLVLREAGIDPHEVLVASRQSLPDYMVPDRVIVLDALPTNANGKLDRGALPDPSLSAQSDRAPSTPAEQAVAAVFGEVLGLDQVGADDDFFELGGNSLIATRVVSRLSAAFEVAVPVRVMFEAPTVSALARVLPSLTNQHRVALTAQQRPDRIPLSAAQRRMWFLNRFDTTAGTNNIPVVLRLAGELDVTALTAAFADVFARHESLRTLYPESDGEGSQLILPPDDARLPGMRIVAVSENTVLDRVVEMIWAGFDVTTEVPVRAGLLTLSPTEHVLVVVLHHITADGFSMGPLTRDVVIAYEARRTGSPLNWTPLSVQYADYTLWQRAALGDESDPESVAARQLAYWSDHLDGGPEEVTLPTDRSRPTVMSGRGGTVRFDLDQQIVAGIRHVARRSGVSDFMVMHAALAVLLGRLAGTSDVVIGSPVAGRGERELDDVVGMFVNTLVLRTRIDWSAPFSRVVREVRDVDLGAFGHADVPFERLVEVIDPPRSQGRHPLFQVALFFQNLGATRFELPGLEITVPELDNPSAKFDLQISVGDQPGADGDPGQIAIELLYATDLFDDVTIERFGRRLQGLLAAVIADPTAVVGDLPVELPGEWASTVSSWGPAPLVTLDSDGDVLQGFWASVRRAPAAPALVSDNGDVVSFQALGDRVGRVARSLVAAGVGPEVSVILGLRRGVDLVVAMYAVLEAGGVFVPVDPDHPAQRVRYVLDVVGDVRILSTSDIDFAGRFGVDRSRVVDLDIADVSDRRAGRLSADERTGPVTGHHSAYVLFTSGSTGRPKGVVVSRGAIANQVAWMVDEFDFAAADVYLQKTPVTFDVSLWGYLVPLSAGTPVVLASPEGHRDPGYLAALVERFGVTLTDFVPSMLVVFAQSVVGLGLSRSLSTLRDVFVIGEALSTEAVRAFAGVSSARLWNIYGPTEAAVSVTLAPARVPVAGEPQASGSVSIGIGEPGVRLYVLDSRLRPVPQGVPGELYIGGVQVARGYLGRPGLSAERFVADPFAAGRDAAAVGGIGGERMYRTGDVVIWDGSGLMYVGRSDFQVKLRGQRIELGEIETVLVSQTGVAAAVVVVAGSDGAERLVGYVVGESGAAIDEATLRESAGTRLPGYMVPERLVILDAFPLNPAGKVDRAALPDPGVTAREFRSPVTVVEGVVAGVLGDVLDVGRVGLDDDFFELGGNSLTAMRVVARLGAALGVSVPVRTIFEGSSVERIAATIEGLSSASRPDLLAVVRPENIPLSLAQARMWFLNRLEPDSVANNIPVVLRLSGPLDLPALATAFADVVERHEVLRTLYPERAGVGTQTILDGGDPRIPALQHREVASSDEVVPVIAEFLTRGFDVTEAVPVRAGIVRVGPEEHLLLVVLHHIAADGFSMLPLTRDVLVAYQARRNGSEPGWALLEIQYANYTLWQRELLGDESDPTSLAHAQLSYWRGQLEDSPEEVTLPLDRPRPAKQSGAGASVRFGIEPQTTAALAAVARRLGATPFMVVHAALAGLLARSTGADDIVIGTPIAGRGERALDDLVGMFVNTLVLRTGVRSAMTFSELVDEVRRVDLDAFAHADLPFERLVEVLDPPRSGGRPPLFQVALSFQNFGPGGGGNVDIDGLTVAPIEDGTPPAKFDLTVTVTEPAQPDAGYTVEIIYATDLFDRSTIDAFVGRFGRVLRAVAESAQDAGVDPIIGDINLLDDAEHAALTRVTGAGEWGFDTLLDVIDHVVTVDPDRTALVDGPERMTYRELDERSARLARELISRGVQAEIPVALALPRSLELTTAIVAVVRAGGTFVPIDVRYPVDRIAHILETSEAEIGVTTAPFLDRLPAERETRWLLSGTADYESALAAQSAQPVTDTDRRAIVHSGTAAYEIFTSGSTGLPKGVVVPNSGLVALLGDVAERTAIDGPVRVLAASSPSFDASIYELLLMLGSAGTLVIAPTEVFGGEELAGLIDRERVTHAFITPSVLGSMDASALSERLDVLVSGGEAVTAAVVAAWAPDRRLYNGYGPTETTICSAFAGPLAEGRRVVIGGPPRGTTLYVLDDRLHPVAPGVAGELYIAGTGVTRGYQGRPDLTAERFVPDPFADPVSAGRRMYRTGDVVRWVEAGVVEYLGRSDDQVKIRGLRIELGEIDAVLADVPGVSAAATVVHGDEAGSPTLVGYVAGDAATLDPDVVVAAAAAKLPGYMVPSVVIVLDALPITGNGKLDRKALPEPVFAAREFRAPTTAVQQAVALTFAEVLGVDRVGVDDDFFDLGGHSLLVTRVTGKLRELTGAPVSLQQVFDHSTVAGLARSIEASEITDEASDFTHFVRLAPDIVPTDSGSDPDRQRPRVALLTGATGFLGSHLVRELIDASMTVICLVRAESEEAGRERVVSSMRRYGSWHDGDGDLIEVIPSDLAAPQLGLTDAQFSALAQRVDVIVHNGARVNHVENYRRLHNPNVRATEDLLRLSVTTRNKPFHFVSTGSVLTDIKALTAAGRLEVGENGRAPAAGVMDNGYVQSKWVAEEIVEIARSRGIPATIHRPGQITGDLETGAAGIEDAFWNMVRAIAGLGMLPDLAAEGSVAMVPVNYVAQAVVALVLDPAVRGRDFNIVNPHRVPMTLIGERLAAAGFSLEQVSTERFATELFTVGEELAAKGDEGLVRAILVAGEFAGGMAETIVIGNDATRAELEPAGVICPVVDGAVLDRYIDYFVRIGFLERLR